MSEPMSKEMRLSRYQDLGLPNFRKTIVELSKLLVQVWLGEEPGKIFKEEIMTLGLHQALENQQIFFPAEWFIAELDPDSFLGSIQMSEAGMWSKPGNEGGLEMILKIPYAPWPQTGVTEAELQVWIERCNVWLKEAKYENPEHPFPLPPNPYIPLATTS